MKYPVIAFCLLVALAFSNACLAWDGFDADTTDLVEVIPDRIPNPGEAIEVRSYDSDNSIHCIVENVRRNRRTIELVVRDAEGKLKTLVMEGR